MAVLPEFEADHCKPACRTNFTGCEKQCHNEAAQAAGYGTPDFDVQLSRDTFSRCVHGQAAGVAGGCDAKLNSCYQSCDAFFAKYYGLPHAQRPDMDDYKNRFRAFENGNPDALAAKPAQVPPVGKPTTPENKDPANVPPRAKPTPKVKPEEKKERTIEPEKDAEQPLAADSDCPRFCKGNILMENGRMGPEGQCWYNPTPCGSCGQTDGFAHCGETEQEKMADLRIRIRKKRRLLKNHCREYKYVDVDEAGNPLYHERLGVSEPCKDFGIEKVDGKSYYFNFDRDDLDVTAGLPESIKDLQAINRRYTIILNSKIRLMNWEQEDFLRSKIDEKYDPTNIRPEMEIAEDLIDNNLDLFMDDETLRGLYGATMLNKWERRNKNTDAVTRGISATFGAVMTEMMLPLSMERGRQQTADYYRVYLKERLKYELNNPVPPGKDGPSRLRDQAHAAATAKVTAYKKGQFNGGELTLVDRPFLGSDDADLLTNNFRPYYEGGLGLPGGAESRIWTMARMRLREMEAQGDSPFDRLRKKRKEALRKLQLYYKKHGIQEVAE